MGTSGSAGGVEGFRVVCARKGREITESLVLIQRLSLTAFDSWLGGANAPRSETLRSTRLPVASGRYDAQISIDSQVGVHANGTLFVSTGVYAFNQGQWRPPRPWAAPNIGAATVGHGYGWNATVNQAGTIGPWEFTRVEDVNGARIPSAGRRPRRPGIWPYMAESRQTYLTTSVGMSRPMGENKWCAYARTLQPQPTPRNLCIGAPPSTPPRYSAINHQNPALV